VSVWLITSGGARVRADRGGLVIGRRSDCGLVLSDPAVSRRHALVRETVEGAELVHLGQLPTVVDGVEVTDTAPLSDGSVVRIGEASIAVVLEPGERRAGGRGWMLRGADGTMYGLTRSPFVVGCGADDDLVLQPWPASAVRFDVVQESLVAELLQPGLVQGTPVPAGELVGLAVGDEVRFGELGMTVLSVGVSDAETTRAARSWAPPTEVSLAFHARGGLLTLTFPDDTISVHLPDRRCDLVAALLAPPGGVEPGAFIPDEKLASRVWPGRPGKGRVDINSLMHRTRRTLVDAGVDGPALLQRAPGGGESRLALAPGARVTIA